MTCTECEKLLMQFEKLTAWEKQQLLIHAAACAACAQKLEFIQLQQHVSKKIAPAEPLHAGALTHKIMQSLPRQRAELSFRFLKVARIGFGASCLVLFFWLGNALLVEQTFHKPTGAGRPVLNSSTYIAHPLERKTKTISLTERIKNKGL